MAAPYHLEIISATAHRKFLLEELTRIGSMTYTDHELVQEINNDLNEVSRSLRFLYKQQQQQQHNQLRQLQPAEGTTSSTHLTPPPHVKATTVSKMCVNTPDSNSSSSSAEYEQYEEPNYLVEN